MAYHRPADLARSAAKLIANRKGMRSDAFRRETFALPRAAAREKARDQLESNPPIERSRAVTRRTMLSRSHARHHTTTPPAAPPVLMCPSCDRPLRYLHSHIGGVSIRHQEQWDYFECPGNCGTFQYRERTRKLKRS